PEAKATVAYTQHGIIVESLAEAEALPHFDRIAALAQTTVLLSEFEKIAAVLAGKADIFENHGQICAWTRMAQDEAEAIAPGCEIVRIAVPTKESAEAFGEIRRQTTLPLVADIHFDYRMALLSIEKGADKIRINPGNIINADGMRAVRLAVDAAKDRGIPIRVGVNAGSIEQKLLDKYGYPTPEAACESAVNHVRLLEDMGFDDIVVSVKFSDVPRMVAAYRLLAKPIEHPL